MVLLGVVPCFANVQTSWGETLTDEQLDSLRQTDDFVRVGLVVADPGEVLYSMLGHVCLRLRCPAFGLDYVFSYESENVDDRIGRFLQGGLTMGLYAIPTNEFILPYQADGRGVREYEMHLPPSVKTELWRVLDKTLQEGNAIPYDYFYRGCAKSIVLVLNSALGDYDIDYADWADKYAESTQRELVQQAITQAVDDGLLSTKSASWNAFWMYLLIGTEGDKYYPCEAKLIVPNDLVEVWQTAKIDGRVILESEPTILCEGRPCDRSGLVVTPMLIACCLLLLAILSFLLTFLGPNASMAAGMIDYLLLMVVTALGGVLTYLILFSSLPCTSWNWLIVPFNVLPALAWYWRRYWTLPWGAVVFLWSVVMLAYPHQIVMPAYIVLAIAFAITLMRQVVCTKTVAKK